MKKYLNIGEFAKLSGISRKNLIYYDNEKIIVPSKREDNGYRMYSIDQLQHAYFVTTLRQLNVSLEDIRQLTENKSIENSAKLFHSLSESIDQQISFLRTQQRMIHGYEDKLKIVSTHEIPSYEIVTLEKENIEITVDNSSREIPFITLSDYCEDELLQGRRRIHHIGKIYTFDALKQSKLIPSYFYVHNAYGRTCKKRGKYLQVLEHSNGHDLDSVYKKIMDYMTENQLNPDQNVYEEFIADELSLKNPEEFVVRIQILLK